MKAVAWIVAALAVIIAIVAFIPKETPRNADPAPVESTTPEPLTKTLRNIVMLPVAETAASLNSPETTATEDIATIGFLISQFRQHHGGNPIGENDEITAALLGTNAKSLGYLSENSTYIDSGGRLTDRWGNPYFFHAISGEKMEIISAGPDLRLYTADDIISE